MSLGTSGTKTLIGLTIASAAIAVAVAGQAFLGVHIEEEVDNPAGGARVTHVVPGSAADEAGIEVGDIIQSVEGDSVRGPRGLGVRLGEYESGDRVTITVDRDGGDVRVEAELGENSLRSLGSHPAWDPERWEEMGEHWAEWGEQFGERMAELGERMEEQFGDSERWEHLSYSFGHSQRPRLGVQLVDPTPELREHLGSDGSTGVLVSKVIDDMPAQDAGIRVGDLIVAVDDEEISDSGDLVGALRSRSGESFAIELIRDGRAVSVDVTLPESDDDGDGGPRAYFRVPMAPDAPMMRFAMPAMPPMPDLPPLPEFRFRLAAPAPPAPPMAPVPPVQFRRLDNSV